MHGLQTTHATERPGVYHAEPVLAEVEMTHWLTLDQRDIPEEPEDTLGARVSAYDGALLDEFFATVNERRAWSEVPRPLPARWARIRSSTPAASRR